MVCHEILAACCLRSFFNPGPHISFVFDSGLYFGPYGTNLLKYWVRVYTDVFHMEYSTTVQRL